MSENNEYYKCITAEHNVFDLNLREIWKYRDLIFLFVKRNLYIRYAQTILGPAWLFLNPLISSIIYCFIFGGIAKIKTGGVPQILFYLLSSALWLFFSTCVIRNATTFITNSRLFGKIYFPRLTLPISQVLTSIIELLIQMLMVVILLVYFIYSGNANPNWLACLAFPLLLIELSLMGMGFGIIIASLTNKYRDLVLLLQYAVNLWMYITPIVYPISQVENSHLKIALYVNPVSAPIEACRYALLGYGEIIPEALIWSLVFTIGVTIAGIMVFNKVERTFMDNV
jgi:lipopolysaccharide transport system permease protein